MNTKDLLNNRAKTHGDFYQGAVIFNDITKHIAEAPLLEPSHRYALSMIATKIARIINGDPDEKDHWQDIVGYATLGGRLNEATVTQTETEE